MTTNNTPSLLLALPEDVQRRLLAGCRYEDLFSLAAACRAVRDVVDSPRFKTARLTHGFVEREIVILGTRRPHAVDIRSARTRSIKVSFTGGLQLVVGGTTTDGRRLFVACKHSINSWKPTFVCALDAISRQWSRFAPLPHNRGLHCMEWYAGRLYVAGGLGEDLLDSFCVYNEATRSWDDLPPMPVACCCASSGIIGDQLLIAGGSRARTLQIFDFTTGQWRLGPPPPHGSDSSSGVVVEDKLFVPEQNSLLIYDPQSEAWTQEGFPRPLSGFWQCACAHHGRLIIFQHNGSAYQRGPDGSWSTYRCTHAHARDALQTPAGEAHGSWGTTRAEVILLG